MLPTSSFIGHKGGCFYSERNIRILMGFLGDWKHLHWVISSVAKWLQTLGVYYFFDNPPLKNVVCDKRWWHLYLDSHRAIVIIFSCKWHDYLVCLSLWNVVVAGPSFTCMFAICFYYFANLWDNLQVMVLCSTWPIRGWVLAKLLLASYHIICSCITGSLQCMRTRNVAQRSKWCVSMTFNQLTKL